MRGINPRAPPQAALKVNTDATALKSLKSASEQLTKDLDASAAAEKQAVQAAVDQARKATTDAGTKDTESLHQRIAQLAHVLSDVQVFSQGGTVTTDAARSVAQQTDDLVGVLKALRNSEQKVCAACCYSAAHAAPPMLMIEQYRHAQAMENEAATAVKEAAAAPPADIPAPSSAQQQQQQGAKPDQSSSSKAPALSVAQKNALERLLREIEASLRKRCGCPRLTIPRMETRARTGVQPADGGREVQGRQGARQSVPDAQRRRGRELELGQDAVITHVNLKPHPLMCRRCAL